MEVACEAQFSRSKNPPVTGKDDRWTCRYDLLRQHRRFLAVAGASIEINFKVELLPLLTCTGEVLTPVKCKTFRCPGVTVVSSVEDLKQLVA